MISVHDLVVRFGRFRAVDGVSFDVAPGEAVALWGPNGAGKTTVLRSVLGLLRYRGTIHAAGLDARRHGRRVRSLIGYVPQELAFSDDWRCREALTLFARLRRAAPRRVEQSLYTVGLLDASGKRVRELSGGMKQRLALAAALLDDPPILLLDEPTSNLDAQAQGEFIHLLAALNRSGKTLLFTSHRPDEVQALGTRVLMLERGRLVRESSPASLRDRSPERALLKLIVAPDLLQTALDALVADGFAASRNGTGVNIALSEADVSRPIASLARAEIRVADVEWVPDSMHEGSSHS